MHRQKIGGTFVALIDATPFSMPSQVVDIRHLNKSYSGQQVLHDICLQVVAGESVGLLGPNGAGKSTLMKILIGLLRPDDAAKGSEPCEVHCADRIGYLSEQNPLYQEMYVREYLRFMAGLTHSEGEVEGLIDRVGLRPEVGKHIRELSKGYKQRVGLAAAMAGAPEVLILDEPTTGLDPNQLEDIRALIRELGKRHTVILSTHILQEVKAICNRVVIIHKGQVRLDKPMAEINDLETTFKQATHE